MVVPSIPERPTSSIPLTGDSQTDSDILAFIKARQSILQKKCKYDVLWGYRSPLSAQQHLGERRGKARASSEARRK